MAPPWPTIRLAGWPWGARRRQGNPLRSWCVHPWLLAAALLLPPGFAMAEPVPRAAPAPTPASRAADFDALLKRLQGTELWAEPSQDAVLRRLAEL